MSQLHKPCLVRRNNNPVEMNLVSLNATRQELIFILLALEVQQIEICRKHKTTVLGQGVPLYHYQKLFVERVPYRVCK